MSSRWPVLIWLVAQAWAYGEGAFPLALAPGGLHFADGSCQRRHERSLWPVVVQGGCVAAAVRHSTDEAWWRRA